MGNVTTTFARIAAICFIASALIGGGADVQSADTESFGSATITGSGGSLAS